MVHDGRGNGDRPGQAGRDAVGSAGGNWRYGIAHGIGPAGGENSPWRGWGRKLGAQGFQKEG